MRDSAPFVSTTHCTPAAVAYEMNWMDHFGSARLAQRSLASRNNRGVRNSRSA